MKLVFISNLFPNAHEPGRGTFNAQQLHALAQQCTVSRVIAPTSAALPAERFDGIEVVHPRFRHVPILSRPLNGWLFARAVEPFLRQTSFDVALVNWAYPDAYGVMLLARKLHFPFATTVQGSDVNVFFQNANRKRQVLRALRASRVVFCRSEALRATLAAEGISAVRVYNGVDHGRFSPTDRAAACHALQLPANRRRILYVGNLQPVKGPSILAKAFAKMKTLDNRLQTIDLLFIGEGPERSKVEQISRQHSVVSYQIPEVRSQKSEDYSPRSTVYLVGAKPHHEIALWMNACDLLCLPSLNEGLPNVALEALSCGLPVVASRVGGVPEVVRDGENGLLAAPSDSHALADALRRALSTSWEKERIVRSVAEFDWNANAQTVLSALQQIT